MTDRTRLPTADPACNHDHEKAELGEVCRLGSLSGVLQVVVPQLDRVFGQYGNKEE